MVANGAISGSDGKEFLCNAETQVRSLDQEDPLEKQMTTQSSILAWEISWTEESMGVPRVRHDLATK